MSRSTSDALAEAHRAYARVKREAADSERVRAAAERDARLRPLRERLWGKTYGQRWWGQP